MASAETALRGLTDAADVRPAATSLTSSSSPTSFSPLPVKQSSPAVAAPKAISRMRRSFEHVLDSLQGTPVLLSPLACVFDHVARKGGRSVGRWRCHKLTDRETLILR